MQHCGAQITVNVPFVPCFTHPPPPHKSRPQDTPSRPQPASITFIKPDETGLRRSSFRRSLVQHTRRLVAANKSSDTTFLGSGFLSLVHINQRHPRLPALRHPTLELRLTFLVVLSKRPRPRHAWNPSKTQPSLSRVTSTAEYLQPYISAFRPSFRLSFHVLVSSCRPSACL